jgi:hypothetical protein
MANFKPGDGDSKPSIRRYCDDFPQDTQLSGWYLPNHHWYHGSRRVFHQVKLTLVVLSQPPACCTRQSSCHLCIKIKGGQYDYIISHWHYSSHSVGAGFNHAPYSTRRGSHITCYRAYSHSSMVSICDLLAIALRTDFTPEMSRPTEGG